MTERVHAGIAADLQGLQDRVWRLLFDIEHNDLVASHIHAEPEDQQEALEESFGRENADLHDALAVTLSTIAARLLIYTEALALPHARDMVRAWTERWSTRSLAQSSEWSTAEADGRESRPFTDLKPVLEGILVLVRPPEEPPPDPIDRRDHERLEYCLRSLAKVCRERNVVPHSEGDVRNVLHSHIEGVFPDYSRNVTVAKPLMSFQPDGGVLSLKAAIECKFVATPEEVATAVHGLTEDLSGYAGSSDWVHFYSIIYMTGAYATEGQFARALGASGNAGAWTTILVTGEGARLSKKEKATKKKLIVTTGIGGGVAAPTAAAPPPADVPEADAPAAAAAPPVDAPVA